MANLTALETYCLFVSLKTHFSAIKYNFFKYNKKSVKITFESFSIRKDKLQFQKLSKMYDETQMQDFIVSNLIKGLMYPVELTTDEAKENYHDYMKRKQSFSYLFTNELDKLFSSVKEPSDLFHMINGEYPKIITMYLSGNVSLETICVLNDFVKFVPRIDKRLGVDDVIWSKVRLLIKKYTPFIQYDKEKIKSILKDAI